MKSFRGLASVLLVAVLTSGNVRSVVGHEGGLIESDMGSCQLNTDPLEKSMGQTTQTWVAVLRSASGGPLNVTMTSMPATGCCHVVTNDFTRRQMDIPPASKLDASSVGQTFTAEGQTCTLMCTKNVSDPKSFDFSWELASPVAPVNVIKESISYMDTATGMDSWAASAQGGTESIQMIIPANHMERKRKICMNMTYNGQPKGLNEAASCRAGVGKIEPNKGLTPLQYFQDETSSWCATFSNLEAVVAWATQDNGPETGIGLNWVEI